jgi:hypothetical protein
VGGPAQPFEDRAAAQLVLLPDERGQALPKFEEQFGTFNKSRSDRIDLRDDGGPSLRFKNQEF